MVRANLTFLTLVIVMTALGQIQPVDVAELTLKVGAIKTENLYYGFAKGDQIVFNFEELKGKPLKEIEIIELPGNSKFMDYKSSQVIDKRIQVYEKTIYHFKFYNSAMSGRICKVKIQRIPKSEDLITFNTNWKWENRYDTSYVAYKKDSLIGFDTTYYKETIREVAELKQIDDMIVDRTERVHSYYNQNPSRTYIRINLPLNKKLEYKDETLVSWAYWIGVGEESKEAYSKNVKTIGGLAQGAASAFGTPLAGYAAGVITDLMLPTQGDDIRFAFMYDYRNAQAFINKQPYIQFEEGKGIAFFGKNSNLTQGSFFIGLHNDNQTTGIDVNIKIVVIKEIRTYQDVIYDRIKVVPRRITLNKTRRLISTTKVRVPAG